MYNILTFDNGQPLILYKEKEKIYMYTIFRGKVTSKGVLFHNVGSDFQLYQSTPYKISYISTNKKLKIYTLYQQHFIEEVSLSLKNDSTIIEQLSTVLYNNELYIFYFSRSLTDNQTRLYYLKSSTLSQRILLEDNVDSSFTLCAFLVNKKIFISFDNQETTQFYYFDTESNLINVFHQSKPIVEATSLTNNEKEIEILFLNNSLEKLTAHYNELSEYTEKLQDELRKTQLHFIYNCQNIHTKNNPQH